MTLFDNVDPEEFFLFIRNSNMTLEASGTLVACINIPYLCTMVFVESLNQFDALSAE